MELSCSLSLFTFTCSLFTKSNAGTLLLTFTFTFSLFIISNAGTLLLTFTFHLHFSSYLMLGLCYSCTKHKVNFFTVLLSLSIFLTLKKLSMNLNYSGRFSLTKIQSKRQSKAKQNNQSKWKRSEPYELLFALLRLWQRENKRNVRW